MLSINIDIQGDDGRMMQVNERVVKCIFYNEMTMIKLI